MVASQNDKDIFMDDATESSTPGQLGSPAVKYEGGLRHPLFRSLSQPQQMFAGSARISGQQDHRSVTGIKKEWAFSNFPSLANNQQYSSNVNPAPPFIAVSNWSPRVSPTVSTPPPAARPPRQRGKLPKETTDYLKAWLNRHSDHPYPSEEEKKQLCNATGLSMAQVSNWMINVSVSIFYCVAPPPLRIYRLAGEFFLPPSGRPRIQRRRCRFHPAVARFQTWWTHGSATLQCRRMPSSCSTRPCRPCHAGWVISRGASAQFLKV